MTPEERAKRAMFGSNAPFMDDDMLTASRGYIMNYPMFVAAIREAVKAERIECAKVCERHALSVDTHQQWGCGYREASNDCAAAIRERPL